MGLLALIVIKIFIIIIIIIIVQKWVTRDFNVIAFFRAKQSGPKFLDPPFLRAVTWVDLCWGKFEGLAR